MSYGKLSIEITRDVNFLIIVAPLIMCEIRVGVYSVQYLINLNAYKYLINTL